MSLVPMYDTRERDLIALLLPGKRVAANSDFFTYTPLLWKLRLGIDNRIEPVLLINRKDESGFLQEILQTGLVIT